MVDVVASQPEPVVAPRRVGPGRVALRLVVALVAGACVVLQVRGWIALTTEVGCGARYGTCPHAAVPVVVVSLILALGTVPFAVGGLFRRPRWLAVLMVLVMVGGGLGAERGFDFSGGPALSEIWSAGSGFDVPSAQGEWTTPDAVIRLNRGQIIAQDAATGAVRWKYQIPEWNVVCTASRATAGDVAMFGYGPSQGGPCVHWVALDLSTGRTLWTMTPAIQDQNSVRGPVSGFVTATRDVVAVVSDAGVAAFNARTGAKVWQTPSVPGCVDPLLDSGPDNVVAVFECRQSYVVADLDPDTGRQRWQTAVAWPACDCGLTLLSADPVVVGERGANQKLRVFTAQGKQNVTIAANQVRIDKHSDGGNPIQPESWTQVFGNTLVATTDEDEHVDLIGYDLTTGQRRWETPVSGHVSAVGRGGDAVLVLDASAPYPKLTTVNPATGASTEVGALTWWSGDKDYTSVYQFGSRYVVVNENAVIPSWSIFAFALT